MPWWKSPLWQIAMFAAALAVLQPLYALVDQSPPGSPPDLADVLFLRAVPLTIVLWMVADAKERRRTPCFDYGFFLLILYPFSLFWYCFRTRSWRGLGLATGLFMLQGVPMMAAAMVDVVRIVFFR